MYTVTLYLVYFRSSMPYEDKLSNVVEWINEIILLLTCYNLLFFTGIIDDIDFVDAVGWSCIICIISMAVFNFGIMFYNLGCLIAWKCKKVSLIRDRQIALHKRKIAKLYKQQCDKEEAENIQKKIDEIRRKNDLER